MKISIIIPCYNSIKFIDRCISSILMQDYDHFDVHIYDNKSTDGTYEHLLKNYSTYTNVNIHSIDNIYPNSYREAFEHAFENIKSEYLTFIASDDYVSKEYISNCMKILLSKPNKIKCIQSPLVCVSSDSRINILKHSYKSLDEFKKQCLIHSPVTTPSVVYHRSIYDKLIMTAHIENKIQCSGAEDYDMFCNLADNNIFIYPIPFHLGYYYCWHTDQSTWKVQKSEVDYDKIIQNYWKKRWTT